MACFVCPVLDECPRASQGHLSRSMLRAVLRIREKALVSQLQFELRFSHASVISIFNNKHIGPQFSGMTTHFEKLRPKNPDVLNFEV